MTDVVLHHVADKQSGQEDTHYLIDQIKVVGLRRIEIVCQEVLYPVYDDFQYQYDECRKNALPVTRIPILPSSESKLGARLRAQE